MISRGVTLITDNSAKREWKGSMECSFFNQNQTIGHLIFDYCLAINIWRIVYFPLNIERPNNINRQLGC
jgi:hypothetical protein